MIELVSRVWKDYHFIGFVSSVELGVELLVLAYGFKLGFPPLPRLSPLHISINLKLV